LYSSHAVRPAYPAEQSTPDALGSVCAVKQNVPRAKLSSLALTDELTGLYNRLGFLYLTERQLKRVRRSARDILLFFIDVDGLKSINDSFGHSEGDSALIHTVPTPLSREIFAAFLRQIPTFEPVLPVNPSRIRFAVNNLDHVCHLHTVEVVGSNPAVPTIKSITYR